MFALGLTMYQFCCYRSRHWNRIDHDAIENINACNLLQIRELLCRSSIPLNLKEWIILCVAWDAQDRPSVITMLDVRREWQCLTKNVHTGPSGSGRDGNEIEDNCDEIVTSMRRLDIHDFGHGISLERPGMPGLDPSQYYSSPTRGPVMWNALETAYESSPFAN